MKTTKNKDDQNEDDQKPRRLKTKTTKNEDDPKMKGKIRG